MASTTSGRPTCASILPRRTQTDCENAIALTGVTRTWQIGAEGTRVYDHNDRCPERELYGGVQRAILCGLSRPQATDWNPLMSRKERAVLAGPVRRPRHDILEVTTIATQEILTSHIVNSIDVPAMTRWAALDIHHETPPGCSASSPYTLVWESRINTT